MVSECYEIPGFDVAGFVPGVQEPFNWFLNFSQRDLLSHILLSQCLCGEKTVLGFLFYHVAISSLKLF